MMKTAENKHTAKGNRLPAWIVALTATAALIGWWVAGIPNTTTPVRATPPKLSDL
ncbi:MAG: hypothetical protein SPI77_08090 [Corynebacterium sp.]|nr:hypothetical protein [Corynebacterium sp.]